MERVRTCGMCDHTAPAYEFVECHGLVRCRDGQACRDRRGFFANLEAMKRSLVDEPPVEVEGLPVPAGGEEPK